MNYFVSIVRCFSVASSYKRRSFIRPSHWLLRRRLQSIKQVPVTSQSRDTCACPARSSRVVAPTGTRVNSRAHFNTAVRRLPSNTRNTCIYYAVGHALVRLVKLSGRTSVSFHDLHLTCSWWVTIYMGKPSAVGQLTIGQLSLSSSRGR